MSNIKWPAPTTDSIYQHPVAGFRLENMAEVLEEFGLPGNRYIVKFKEHSITLQFQQSQDAVFCALKFR
jgi:hypothetical protein